MITTEQMVQREVLCCMSSLVSTLAQGSDVGDPRTAIEALCDQACELAAPVLDYEEAAFQDGWKHAATESDRCMVFTKVGDTIRACTWGELCELQSLDPYEWEVYEHWAVSQWLADKLNIWARTATGQAIGMDGCIQRIYKAMTALRDSVAPGA